MKMTRVNSGFRAGRVAAMAASFVAVLLVTGSGQSVSGQEPVTGVDDPESLFTSKDPQLHANKQVVLHIVRDLLQEGRWDEAPKYLTERYIQHNPLFPSGRETVMKAFSGMARRSIPKGNKWPMKVVSVVAEGDLVVVAIVREQPHPTKKGEPYTTTWFDIWRVKEGKADEHWDGATLPATRPGGSTERREPPGDPPGS